MSRCSKGWTTRSSTRVRPWISWCKAAPELKANVESEKWKEMLPATSSRSVPPGGLDRAKWEALNELLKTYEVIEAKVDLNGVLKNEYR